MDEKAIFPYSTEWYERKGIDLRLGVEAKIIDIARNVLVTSKGNISYDVLVLATGARARKPSYPGGSTSDPKNL